MIERAAVAAGLPLKAHPHMLRHACGYALANKGHDTQAIHGWLDHRSITTNGDRDYLGNAGVDLGGAR